jgi:hypothetical protein
MKAYLEKCDKEWFDDFVYTARQPLEDRGFTIVPFDGTFLEEFIEKTSFDKNDIIIGSVESTKAFWKTVGIEIPKYIGYPKSLDVFYGRKIYKGKFGEITDKKGDGKPSYELPFTVISPIFIKPADGVKEFTGFVLEKISTLRDINLYYPEVNSDTEIYISEVVDIISEYRCFVHKNKLVGIKHYDGDFTRFPNISIIELMIDKYKNDSPISYTLDVGIISKTNTTNYETILIEINDFWAIGGYGLDGKTYVRMLIDRFQEIKK